MRKQIIKGTMILSAAGICVRVLGVYHRVLLARILEPAQIGIYQLIFPILGVCMALCCYGIENALSKMTASFLAVKAYDHIQYITKIALCLVVGISLLVGVCVYGFAEPIAKYIIHEEKCSAYLQILAMVLPFCAVHGCVSGYFLGLQETKIPAISQLFEQCVRIGFIVCVVKVFGMERIKDASVALWAMFAGEAGACMVSITAYKIRTNQKKSKNFISNTKKTVGQLLSFAYPMTISKVLMTALQSAEAILIPLMLYKYYHDREIALETFGVITGMVFPFIMFPTTFTNALATMLMPEVSKAQKEKAYRHISNTVSLSVCYCFLIGIFATAIFLGFGKILGILIFKQEMAGIYLMKFAFVCPLIYMAATIAGALNGLGKVKVTLYNNMLALGLRIGCIVILVPFIGIKGYLCGMLLGYLAQVLLGLYELSKYVGLSFNL